MLSTRFLPLFRHAAALIFTGIAILAFASAKEAVSKGTVFGTVEAVERRAVLPEITAKLVFSGSGGEYESNVDKKGRYEISLPAPDVYNVQIVFFNCTLTRAAFHLKPGEKLEFIFVGVNCPTWEPTPLPNWQMERNTALPFESPGPCRFADKRPVWYREQRLKADPVSHRPEIVISFGRCEESAERVTYFSLDPSLIPDSPPKAIGDLSLPVAITTEALTVRADKIARPNRSFTFYASGNVTVEDGRGHVSRAQAATLSFPEGHPKIKIRN